MPFTSSPGVRSPLRNGERVRAEGVKIAQEALLSLRDLVQGVQIAAPFGCHTMAVEATQVLGERTTTTRAVGSQLSARAKTTDG